MFVCAGVLYSKDGGSERWRGRGSRRTSPSPAQAGLDEFYKNSYIDLHLIEGLCVCAMHEPPLIIE